MKISCPACNARYRIPDDRVKGKNRIFKVKCKRCGSTVRVRGLATGDDLGRQTMPFNLQMPEAAPATPQRVWFVGIDGKQVGPLTEQEVIEHIGAARLGADDLMWRKGFSAWTPVREVAPFQDQVAAAAPSAAQPAGRKHRPRRAQTLELSASMIELLVKLDERTDHGSDGDPATDAAGPPELPDGGAEAEVDALPPLADDEAPPIPPDEDEAVVATAPTEAADAGPAEKPTETSDEQPPVVPGTTAAPADPAKAAEPDVAVAAALEATTDRRPSKVSLPGQVAAKPSKKATKGKRGKRGRASRQKAKAATDPRAALGSGASPSGKIASLSGGSRGSAAKSGAQGKAKPAVASKEAPSRTTGAKGKVAPAAQKKKKKKGSAWLFIGLLALAAIAVVGVYLAKGVIAPKVLKPTSPQTVAAAPTEAVSEQVAAVEPVAAAEPPPEAPVEADAGSAPAAQDAGSAGSAAVDAGAPAAPDATEAAVDSGAAASKDAGQAAAAAPVGAGVVPEEGKVAGAARQLSEEEIARRKARRDARDARRAAAPAKVEPKPVPTSQRDDDIDKLLANAKRRNKRTKKARPPPPPPPPPKKKPTEMDDIDRLLKQAKNKKKTPPPPVRKPSPPPTKGGLTKKQVNAVAAGARSKIMRCYFMHADVDGSETLKVELRIGGDGHVISARVKGKHSGDQVGSCVTVVVKKLRFPRSGGASSKHTVRYTVGG